MLIAQTTPSVLTAHSLRRMASGEDELERFQKGLAQRAEKVRGEIKHPTVPSAWREFELSLVRNGAFSRVLLRTSRRQTEADN